MLPIISIDIKDVCSSESWHSGLAYLFDFHEVTGAAQGEGMNLDRFLTLRIGSFLARKKLRSNVLLCYTSYQGLFILTVCSKYNTDLSNINSWLPGCLEFGREDSLPARAAPFMFYGGLQIYRLYSVREQPATGYYVCDCALCDLPHARKERWVRGEKRTATFTTKQVTAETEKGVRGKQGYSLYLRQYCRGEDVFPSFGQNNSFSLSSSGYYVCDLGCVFGTCIAEARKDDYERIRDQPEHHADYSTIPIEPSEELAVDGINYTLQHALCKWTR